jgi:hypothetical protein
MKKKIVILVILLLGILFPFAAMTRFSIGYAEVFNAVFDSLLSHIFMHAALFAALSWIMMSFFSKRPIKTKLWIALGSVLVVALTQEAIQMFSTHTSGFGAALFDLGVDLIGGLIPFMFLAVKNRFRRVDHV